MRWHTRLALAWRIIRGDFRGYLWDKQHRVYRFDIGGSMGPDTHTEKATWQ